MQKGFTTSVLLTGFLVLIFAGAGGFWAYKNNFQNIRKIPTYDECVKAGYAVMESYPARCRTPDGQFFTQPISDEDKKKLDLPSKQNSETVFKTKEECVAKTGGRCMHNLCQTFMGSTENTDCKPGWYQDKNAIDTTNWKTFTHPKLKYTFKYPSDWSNPGPSMGEPLDSNNVRFFKLNGEGIDQTGKGYDAIMDVTVEPFPKDQKNLIDWFKNVELVKWKKMGRDVSKITYEATTLNGNEALMIDGTIGYVNHEGNIYVFNLINLAKSRGTDDYSTIGDEIISTFKFEK